MTLAAYRSLYESSTAYGMRKALMAESGKSDLESKINEIANEKEELDLATVDLQTKMEEMERKFAEQRENEEKKHGEEIQFLKRANQQIKVIRVTYRQLYAKLLSPIC